MVTLRNTQKVKPATVQKVQEAIAATGYRPNLMARALAEGKSSMVALVVPDITNPFLRVRGRGRARGARPQLLPHGVQHAGAARHRPRLP